MVLHDFPEWRLHFHLLQSLPVEINAGEEFVVLDVVPGFMTKSLSGLKLQQRVDEVLQLLAHVGVLPVSVVLGRLHQSFYSLPVLYLRAAEGRTVVRHFVSKDSHCPKVYLFLVAQSQHHFRRIVNGRACFSLRQFLFAKLLGQSKVCKFGIPILKDKYIFRFQISIHDEIRMQILHTQNETGQDKPNSRLSSLLEIFKPLGVFVDKRVGVATLRPFHDKVQILGVPKGVVQGSDELTLRLMQNFLLQLYAGGQLALEDL